MGMLLRRKSETTITMTTAADLNKKPVKKVEEVTEVQASVKDEKPKTVKRGRPTKR